MRSSFLLLLALALDLTPASLLAAPGDEDPAHCFAKNLYFEARSEGREGMIAVGWVVLNRVDSELYPDTICGVIYDGGERPPCEFNWWCDGRSDRPTERQSWELAQEIAAEMLDEPPPDPTDGALWFHGDWIEVPEWLQDRKRTLHLGDHFFYR